MKVKVMVTASCRFQQNQLPSQSLAFSRNDAPVKLLRKSHELLFDLSFFYGCDYAAILSREASAVSTDYYRKKDVTGLAF